MAYDLWSFDPTAATPGSDVLVTVSGEFVDEYMNQEEFEFILATLDPTGVSPCTRKKIVLTGRRWVECEVTIPLETEPGLWKMILNVLGPVHGDSTGIQYFSVLAAPTTTTAPPTTTTAPPTTTTAPPTTTTAPPTTTTAPPTTVTSAIVSTSPLAAQDHPTTPAAVVNAAADAEPTAGDGGPTWLTSGVVAALAVALAVALTVIVVQNLQRRQGGE
jgi:hypothetical protein